LARQPVTDATTLNLSKASLTLPLGAVLKVSGVADAPPPFKLDIGRCTVGSSSEADVVVRDKGVSRKHLELALVPEGVAVRDLGSRNGTFYLGQRVEKMVVSLGARLQIGEATLTIDANLDESARFDGSEYRGMIGAAACMRQMFAKLVRLEGSLATVLIEGETGAGKELVARALHEGSRVASGPMVTLNCGAIPHELVASELFGHVKGAFTGAIEDAPGAMRTADGGTLFLDEVGELPIDVQPMLLRALEAGEVRAVGSQKTARVKVRVLCATNRDLAAEVSAGRFRKDLFYRLAVVHLRVPSLAARIEDVEPLARRFAEEVALAELPRAVVEELRARAWPGNVRELKNAVQVYAALGVVPDGSPEQAAAALDLVLGELVDLKKPYAELKEAVIDHFTRVYLRALLAHAGGNQSTAARLAGLDRTYLGRLVQKYGLK
jgi:two-component system, NtrC family, response regulator GlrR